MGTDPSNSHAKPPCNGTPPNSATCQSLPPFSFSFFFFLFYWLLLFYYCVPSVFYVIGFHLLVCVLRWASFLLVLFSVFCFMIPLYLCCWFISYTSLFHYCPVVGLGPCAVCTLPLHSTLNRWQHLTWSIRLQNRILHSSCYKPHDICFYFYQNQLSYKEVTHGKMSSAFTHV